MDIENALWLILVRLCRYNFVIHWFTIMIYSKYSMLGCIRIISQLISFELIWTTIILIFMMYWNELSITNYWCFVLIRSAPLRSNQFETQRVQNAPFRSALFETLISVLLCSMQESFCGIDIDLDIINSIMKM